MKSIKSRVAKGIAFLNKEYGRSWLRKIDLERLALEDCKACVLGQVEGDYNNAIQELDIDGPMFGFSLTTQEAQDDRHIDRKFADLTNEWRRQIARLRKARLRRV